jgi:hypothetical protein
MESGRRRHVLRVRQKQNGARSGIDLGDTRPLEKAKAETSGDFVSSKMDDRR